MTKVCSRCKEEKSISDFGKDRTRKGGIRCTCRACAREQTREYREKYREKVREYDRKYREKNREKVRERARKYRENNQEKIREKQRKYREDNLDYVAAKQRETLRKKDIVSASMATKSGRWSQEEVDLLIELRKTRTVYQCAIELGRKFKSTRQKIDLLRKNGVEV